jgi:hypothetical protein
LCSALLFLGPSLRHMTNKFVNMWLFPEKKFGG